MCEQQRFTALASERIQFSFQSMSMCIRNVLLDISTVFDSNFCYSARFILYTEVELYSWYTVHAGLQKYGEGSTIDVEDHAFMEVLHLEDEWRPSTGLGAWYFMSLAFNRLGSLAIPCHSFPAPCYPSAILISRALRFSLSGVVDDI